MQEPEPPVFEQPYGQDGERQEHDEYEEIGAVLPVAFLGHPLRGDVVHRAALASAPGEQERQQERQRRRRFRRRNTKEASHGESHRGSLRHGHICRFKPSVRVEKEKEKGKKYILFG